MSGKKTKKRAFTVMVIPHRGEKVRSIRLPTVLLPVSGIILLGLIIALAGWSKSYIALREEAVRTTELASELGAENRKLNEEVDLLARETADLKERVSGLHKLGVKITEIIDDTDPEEIETLGAFLGEKTPPTGGEEGAPADLKRTLLESRGGNEQVGETAGNIVLLQSVLPEQKEALQRLIKEAEEYRCELEATPSIWPAQGRVSSTYGLRTHPITGRREFHYGLDIAAPMGDPVFAAARGEVTEAAYRRGLGNVIIIEHGYSYSTLYAHLSAFHVEEGDHVEKGEEIGCIGSTGFSTGPHLHYEVHQNGAPVDPEKFLP